MALPNLLICQFWLYLLRPISILAIVVLDFISSRIDTSTGYIIFFGVVPGIIILHDITIILVWDVYFCNCIISTAIVQIVFSLSTIPLFGFHISLRLPLNLFLLVYPLPIIFSLILTTTTMWACWNKPRKAWWFGVKELASNGNATTIANISLLGKRRKQEDPINGIWLGAWSSLLNAVKLMFVRRIPDVETLQFALWRNITAMVLLLILIAQSVRLIQGVILENFAVQETWDKLGFNTGSPSAFAFIYRENSSLSWDVYTLFHDSLVLLPDLPRNKHLDLAFLKGSIHPIRGRPSSSNVSIAMVSNAGVNSSGTGDMWIGLLQIRDARLDHAVLAMTQYMPPFQLIPGRHIFGRLNIAAERRMITSSLSDMMGFTPQYHSAPLISIQLTDQLLLENQSIAQATFQWDRDYTQQREMLYQVIIDRRQHTFLDALSSLGGLLAILQGLHILLFGRPLWWGLFGSKTIDPFGLLGAKSLDFRRRMVMRYGYIPSLDDTSSGSARALGLFLSDFVMDVGPLDKRDEDVVADEHLESGTV